MKWRVYSRRKKTGYDLQEELILDDWIAEQEMKGQVVKDRQSVWGFLNQRLQKRRKKTDPNGMR